MLCFTVSKINMESKQKHSQCGTIGKGPCFVVALNLFVIKISCLVHPAPIFEGTPFINQAVIMCWGWPNYPGFSFLNPVLIWVLKLGAEGEVDAAEMFGEFAGSTRACFWLLSWLQQRQHMETVQGFSFALSKATFPGPGRGIFCCVNYVADFQPDAGALPFLFIQGISIFVHHVARSSCLPLFQPVLIRRVKRSGGFFVSHLQSLGEQIHAPRKRMLTE